MIRRTAGVRPPAERTSESTAPLPAPELTEAECRRCGTYIAGLDGRYACGVCGWVNDHSEGHRRLPTADEDPDRPAKGRRRAGRQAGPGSPTPAAAPAPTRTPASRAADAWLPARPPAGPSAGPPAGG
ncbi:hypothetical protein [Streptomyces sp. NPDC091268]|uniref:hypothetical protein n=1 Tax=Streptomyces sp. NPDC091268 TaxID=3365979 RepID=UPI00382AAB64